MATLLISDLVYDVLNGKLGPEDFHDVAMLEDINSTLKKLMSEHNEEFSDLKIVRTRKTVLERIETLKSIANKKEEDEDLE